MKISMICILSITVLTLVTSGCSAPSVGLIPRVGAMDIDGDIGVTRGGGIVKAKTSANALGLDEETVFQPRVDLDWTDVHVSINAMQPEFSGDGQVTATLNLPGRTITVGTPVSSDWELELYTASFVYDIIPTETIDIGIGAGIGMIGWDISLASKVGPARISGDDDLPFAFLAARIAKELGRFDFQAQINGAGVEYEDEDLSYFEVDVNAGYRFWESDSIDWTALVGYRHIGVDYEWEEGGGELDLDADFDGPYIGLMARF